MAVANADLSKLRSNPAVRAFVDTVRSYLAFIDSPPAPEALPRACATLLTRLYEQGMRLPDAEPSEEDVATISRPPSIELHAAIGERDVYWLVLDPFDANGVVAGSLSEDLTSVYEDMAAPLALFDREDEEAARTAVWQWRFNMETHTGKHIIGALNPLHALETGTSA
jgi:hypothetical protein